MGAEATLIESDDFPIEFLSRLAERESWRKELHRPIYHVHKWWANRLGSVFRGMLLASILPRSSDLEREFCRRHSFSGQSVLDPFMGSGTTIGEAHKLGLSALGRDINPVAVEAVSTALGSMDRHKLLGAFEMLEQTVGRRIRGLYGALDSRGRCCEVLYYFWVMQSQCPDCRGTVDLFPSFVIARHAFPNKKREVRVLCPDCGDIFSGTRDDHHCTCPSCGHAFDSNIGNARGKMAICRQCSCSFKILDSVRNSGTRPNFRLYGKLVLTIHGTKEYLPVTPDDISRFQSSSQELNGEIKDCTIALPDMLLESGYNTRQAMNYGFRCWRDFFNDRQLLALGWLQGGIQQIEDPSVRRVMMTLFSGVLEFNNMFASYKGEGTGAVRHMFSHHILKPERMPIEANVWGTPKSSGSFSGLMRTRLLRALDYRESPTELTGKRGPRRVCSAPFSGEIEAGWPSDGRFLSRGIYLSCGNSADLQLPDGSVDLIVTDPPFFDNVHYSELADFFRAWHGAGEGPNYSKVSTTRSSAEVQDTEVERFTEKLTNVFHECSRVLKDSGLLVFTYHHSRTEGWHALADALFGVGFYVVNAHPVKGEMSVATPKSQAKAPIQLDVIIVCRKMATIGAKRPSVDDAISSAQSKARRLVQEGFRLSRNDRKVVLLGQLLQTIRSPLEIQDLLTRAEAELDRLIMDETIPSEKPVQQLLF